MEDQSRKVGLYIRTTGPKGGAGGSGVSIEQPSAQEAKSELAALFGEETAGHLIEGLRQQLLETHSVGEV